MFSWCTDHFPIITNIDLPQLRIPPDLSFNFRIADREDFNKTLKIKLNLLLHLEPINSLQELENAGNELTRVLQQTIKEKITWSKPSLDAKRWWNGELSAMKKNLNRLRSESYNYWAIANHYSHRELRIRSRAYGKAIILAIRTHWMEYLEEMMASDIWIANKYLKNPAGDGGQPWIPTIKTGNAEGRVTEVNNNEDKAKVFTKAFFPPPARGEQPPIRIPRATTKPSFAGQKTDRKDHTEVIALQGPGAGRYPQYCLTKMLWPNR